MLHITNGDSAAAGVRGAGLSGATLAWRDVLEEGPVPGGVSDEALRATRAGFIADQGWTSYDEAMSDFLARDDILDRLSAHDDVTLWFEHDLHDQLQLLQILDKLSRLDWGDTHVSLISLNRFPGVEPFHGLGQLTPEQLATLWDTRRAITMDELRLARRGWAAFRAPDPHALSDLIEGDTSALPFLRAALIRLTQEYPGVNDGLSRTERAILRGVEGGGGHPDEVMRAVTAAEEAPFRGDAGLWFQMRSIVECERPLLARTDGHPLATSPGYPPSTAFLTQKIALTDLGRDVLTGNADHIAINGLDRWIGGAHLLGREISWRWDAATNAMTNIPADDNTAPHI